MNIKRLIEIKLIEQAIKDAHEIYLNKEVETDSEAGTHSQEVIIDEELSAPVEAGQKIGTARLTLDNEVLSEVDIVSAKAIDKATIGRQFGRIIKLWLFG